MDPYTSGKLFKHLDNGRREQRETDAWVRGAHVLLWPTFVFTMVNFVLLIRAAWL